MDLEKIGNMIRRCRLELGLTQAELAEKVGVSDKAVSKWEKGYTIPKSIVFAKLADVLGLSVTELFEGQRKEKPEVRNKAKGRKYILSIIIGALIVIMTISLICFLN